MTIWALQLPDALDSEVFYHAVRTHAESARRKLFGQRAPEPSTHWPHWQCYDVDRCPAVCWWFMTVVSSAPRGRAWHSAHACCDACLRSRFTWVHGSTAKTARLTGSTVLYPPPSPAQLSSARVHAPTIPHTPPRGGRQPRSMHERVHV